MKCNLCLILTKNFPTLLKLSDEMFTEGALVRENVRGFVHRFRKMETSETITAQETWLRRRVRIIGTRICALSDRCERRQKLRMS
jgi:hypothetical protein